jgi:hypothetical protein
LEREANLSVPAAKLCDRSAIVPSVCERTDLPMPDWTFKLSPRRPVPHYSVRPEMPRKPSTPATVVDVINIVISGDPAEGAIIKLAIEGSTDVDLMFNPLTLVKLQAALAKMDQWHADAQLAQ